MINESANLASSVWQVVLGGSVFIAAVPATVLAVRHHRSYDDTGSDHLFWDLFIGAVVAVPALVIATVASPWLGLVLAASGAAAGWWAFRTYPRLAKAVAQRRRRREAAPALRSAEARHDQAVARWQRYELDPGLTIDFPAMSDPRKPETAELIKALRSASAVKADADPDAYIPAVDRLEAALLKAETAAGAMPRNEA